MQVKAIKTRLMQPPKDDLYRVIARSVKRIPERSILAVASKVVSLHQGRCVARDKVKDKDSLIRKEADRYLPRELVPSKRAVLTIKHNILIPTAGIDESNANGYYILWPTNPDKAAEDIYNFIKKKYRVKKFGVVITDSHTEPLRRGVVGVALSFFGFAPVNDFRGQHDLFNRQLKITTVNVADGLAVSAVLAMGESTERTPLALITKVPFVHFFTSHRREIKKYPPVSISPEVDLYQPLIEAVKWRRNK